MHGNKGHRKPSAKSKCDDATDCADQKDVPKALGNIHRLLQHYHTEWDSRNPTDETNDGEDTEEGEYDGRRPIVLTEIVYRGPDSEDNLQYARDPNELLSECTSHRKIEP